MKSEYLTLPMTVGLLLKSWGMRCYEAGWWVVGMGGGGGGGGGGAA